MREIKRLITAFSLSSGGDMLFAFFWNAALVSHNPSMSFSAMGLASLMGVLLASGLSPLIRRKLQAHTIITFGNVARALGTAIFLCSMQLLSNNHLIFAAAAVFFVDMFVGVTSSGVLDIVMSNSLTKNDFISIQGFKQWTNKLFLLVALVLGPVLIKNGSTWILIVDILTFIPLIIVAQKFKGISVGGNSDYIHINKSSILTNLKLGLPFFVIVFFGGLISKTTPLLWNISRVEGTSFLAVLFGAFLSGNILSGFVFDNVKVQSIITNYDNSGLVKIFGFLAGVSFLLMTVSTSSDFYFTAAVISSGFFCGSMSISFFRLLRSSFDGNSLNKVFILNGAIGYYLVPIADLAASVVLKHSKVATLYYISGSTFVVFSILFFNSKLLKWWSSNENLT